ncbi:MAG: GAF and ANTAR domain-containing protein [Actinomycetota bacterium]|nr:GAF and ANTAR domain-containing protein [Actinomycetota bacterium]
MPADEVDAAPLSSDDDETLADTLSDAARSMESQDGPHLTLVEIVVAAVEMIPGCDEGSISVVVRKTVSSDAASGDLPRIVDAIQTEVGQGPCLDAVRLATIVVANDLATETRWPSFSARAAEAGAAAMMSLHLFVEGENLGALNLFARTPGAFTSESEHTGLLFASHAAIAFASAQKLARVQVRVAAQLVIGQAEGILMERHRVTSDVAFGMLVRASQARNMRLEAVADQLVVEGHL